MEAQEAAARVGEWLAGGEHAVRVDHANVVRVPEGWFVPYDTVRALDGGEWIASLVPKPALIVCEDGELRRPDAGREGTGPSSPVPVAGRDEWREILEPEFRESGVAYLGVHSAAVMAWRKFTPDGAATGEVRVNPGYRPGPRRLGHRPMDTPLEHLLGYLAAGQHDRGRYLAGLLSSEVLLPVDFRTERPLPSLRQEEPPALRVFSSRRRLPPGTAKWVRAGVLSLLSEFPGVGLSINPGSDLPDVVSAAELAAAVSRWPKLRSSTRVVEVSPEYSESVSRTAERIRADFGLAGPITGLPEAAAKARSAGFELTARECERFLLGRAWEQRNGVTPAAFESPHDDLTGHRWPDDLRANGLTAGHDAAGRVRPHAATGGKFFRRDIDSRHSDGGDFAWHRVTGAFVGSALGEALGTGLPGVLEIGPLTRHLLFCTEGLLRALPAPYRGSVPSGLMTIGVQARRRQYTGNDGWLSRVRGPGTVPADEPGAVGFLVPGMVAALCGGRTAARVARLLATGDGADEVTAEAASVVANLFSHLFQRADPPRVVVQRLLDSGTTSGPVAEALATALRAGAGESGRGAFTGAFAGAVAGSRAGIPGLPQEWLDRLGGRDLVETVAGDAFWHFSAQPPSGDGRYAAGWAVRYPRDL
ncbi:YrhB domain-containing protein [Amycolatopsis sp. cmx-11-51]|uniref:YrhB domain-containing protein n=1 Tax=Amycolatopsis sp. cmx-11-51 TaxID=2785797 RepID=UPI0039E66DF2